MKRQGGFTLIELVVVIVILGILAVTAAPRFLNLQDDARRASLEGLRGAIAGAMGITYGRAAIAGIETQQYAAGDVNSGGTEIDGIAYSYGHPVAANDGGIGDALDLSSEFAALDASSSDFDGVTNTYIEYGFTGFTDACVRYTAASRTGTDPIDPAKVEIVVNGKDSITGACGATP